MFARCCVLLCRWHFSFFCYFILFYLFFFPLSCVFAAARGWNLRDMDPKAIQYLNEGSREYMEYNAATNEMIFLVAGSYDVEFEVPFLFIYHLQVQRGSVCDVCDVSCVGLLMSVISVCSRTDCDACLR